MERRASSVVYLPGVESSKTEILGAVVGGFEDVLMVFSLVLLEV